MRFVGDIVSSTISSMDCGRDYTCDIGGKNDLFR